MRRVVLFTFIAGAAAALVPRLVLTWFAFPSADDYCIVNETLSDGFWYMQVHSYLTWTGRYAAVLLESVVVQFDLIAGYRWFSLATLIATIAGIHALTAAVSGRNTPRFHVAVMALIAAAIFVGGLPSVVEAFYWMPGEASYQWGTATYFVWLALLLRGASGEDPARRHAVRRAAIVALTLVIPGFNEVMAPIIFATLAAILVANRRHRFDDDGFLLTLVGLVAVLTAVSFLAPGNRARSVTYADIPSRHNLSFALIETGRQTARFILHYGSYPAMWLATLAAWWWGESRLPGTLKPEGRFARDGAVLAALVGVVYLTLFPVYWEYGAENYSGEGRTYNVTYVALCAVVLWVAGHLVARVPDGFRVRLQSGIAGSVIAVAVALLVVATPSTLTTFTALKMAPGYLRAERARAAYLRTAPHTGTVFVDGLSARPPGLFWADIQTDVGHWINDCVAKYYGLKAVQSRM
jgi:hypothetical protein